MVIHLKYACCICKERFSDSHSLEVHIAVSHVFYTAYECEICQNALFPTDYSLREHYEKIHNRRVYSVKYKVNPELEKRRELLRQLVVQSSPPGNEVGLQHYYGPQTSQMLQSCITSQLLKANLFKSTDFLNKIKVEDDAKMEENDATDMNQDYLDGNNEPEMLQGSSTAVENSKLFGTSTYHQYGESSYFDEDNSAGHHIQQNRRKHFKETAMDSKSPTKKRGKRRKGGEEDNSNETSIRDEHQNEEVECLDCKRKVGKYRNSMLIHTSTHHCDQPIFECLGEGCDKKWYSLSARHKEHIEAKHGGNISLLKDNRSALLPLLRAETAKLFPLFYSNSVKMMGGAD